MSCNQTRNHHQSHLQTRIRLILKESSQSVLLLPQIDTYLHIISDQHGHDNTKIPHKVPNPPIKKSHQKIIRRSKQQLSFQRPTHPIDQASPPVLQSNRITRVHALCSRGLDNTNPSTQLHHHSFSSSSTSSLFAPSTSSCFSNRVRRRCTAVFPQSSSPSPSPVTLW